MRRLPRSKRGWQNHRRHGIASAHFTCPSKPSSVAIARLFDTDDHAETMAALGALGTPAATPTYGGNVIPLHG